MDTYKLICDYIDESISYSNSYMDALSNIKKLTHYIKSIDEICLYNLVEIVKNNEKISKLLKLIVTNNFDIIENPKNVVGDDYVFLSLLEIYCNENKIEIYSNVDEQVLSNKDSAYLYINEIKNNCRNHKILSIEEEKDLFLRFNSGDLDAKKEIVNHNLGLVISIAKYYHIKGMDFADLIQEGNIGLIKAVDKYDCNKGYKFSTYATWWIRQSIQTAIADKSRNIRIPFGTLMKINDYKKNKSFLENKFGRKLSEVELSNELNIDLSKIYLYEMILDDTCSLDSTISHEVGTTMEYFIPDKSISVEDYFCRKALYEYLIDILDNKLDLSEREKAIIVFRFGLFGADTKTLKQLSKKFGVTGENIRQIEKRVLRKIRKLYGKDLVEFTDYPIENKLSLQQEFDNKVLKYKKTNKDCKKN